MKKAFSTARVASKMMGRVVLFRPRRDLFQVRHRKRLTAGHVHTRRNRQIGNRRRALFVDQFLQLVQVDVAFERMRRIRVVRLVDDAIVENATGAFGVFARGGKVHIHRHVLARLDANLRRDVLRGAPLVRRHDVLETVDIVDGLLEIVEITRARVCLVAQHHPRPLPVAHRAGARIGEQINVDVFALEQEGVVARFDDLALPIFARRHFDRLDHLDFVRFGNRSHFQASPH